MKHNCEHSQCAASSCAKQRRGCSQPCRGRKQMNHDFDNDNDNDMDDDDGEEVPRAPKPPKNGAAAKAPKKSSNKESERKKRELITMGKAKGFLTYDEVNEHMPENIISSDQMDDWLSAFSGEGIEIVDSSSKLKVAGKGEAADA